MLFFTSFSLFSGSYLQALLTEIYKWLLEQSLGFPSGISVVPCVKDEYSDAK